MCPYILVSVDFKNPFFLKSWLDCGQRSCAGYLTAHPVNRQNLLTGLKTLSWSKKNVDEVVHMYANSSSASQAGDI